MSFAPDPAFALPVENQTEALAFLARYGYKNDGHNIGATIISPMGHFLNPERLENYYTTVARALDRLASEYQVRIFLFNQVTGPTAIEDDRLAVEKLLARIPGDLKRVSWVNETLSPALLSACYGQMQLFIASRLHSGIFALSMGVPTLFIGFLTKTRGVMEAIGLENWVVDFSFLDEAKLWERLQTSWLEKEAYAARLQEILPPLKKSVLDISTWISKDYEQYQQENTPRSNH